MTADRSALLLAKEAADKKAAEKAAVGFLGGSLSNMFNDIGNQMTIQ